MHARPEPVLAPDSGWPVGTARPDPPALQVFPVTVDRTRAGMTTGELTIGPYLSTGRGLSGAGMVALLADCVLGLDAVFDTGAPLSTVVLSVDFLAPPPETGVLRAESGPPARRPGFRRTSATVRTADGTETARVTGWFSLRQAATGPSGAWSPSGTASTASPWPGRGPTPAPVDVPATPLGRTLGLTGQETAADGTLSFLLPDSGPLFNSGGTLHGGVSALLASVAALATLPGAPAPEVLSMTCHYLRAAGGPCRAVRADGRTVRRGRTGAVVEGTVRAPDGRPAMLLQLTARLGS